MNILLTTQEDTLAGSSFSVSYLAIALKAKGHDVYVAARPDSVLHGLIKNSGVIFLPFTITSRFDKAAIRLLKLWVEKYSIDVINAQSSKDRYITMIARLFYGVKALLFHTRRQYPKSAGGYFQRLLYVKGTDKIIMISEELKRIFVSKGFPEKHLHVIQNGIPASRYQQWSGQEVIALKKLHGIKDDDVVIGSVSRFKKQEQLIRALKTLNMPHVKVILVGPGILPGHFDALCTKLGIENQVIFVGDISPDKVLNYYKLLTVNILPSTSEGFGLVLLEAMALGAAVVATNFGGIKDVVKHGVNGLLFEDDNLGELAGHIRVLLQNETYRNQLIEQGYNTAFEEFTIEKTASKYESFFTNQIALAEK